MTLGEGTQKTIQCAINRNAVPAPNITWYLGFTDITKTAKAVKSYITITGNRTDNTKTLECRATNNKKPSKTASTTLNVECKCIIILDEKVQVKTKLNALNTFH